MVDKVSLVIDGLEIEAKMGATVLEAAREAGIYIPTICHDPDLEPYGGCRLCVVEIDKMRGLPIACTTAVAEGMVVRTETPAIYQVRRTLVEFLLAEHHADCLVCLKNQRCELQKVAAYLGIDQHRFPNVPKTLPVDSSNPFFYLDPNQCIYCAKCVRTCHEIVGVDAIDFLWRGYESKVGVFGNKPIVDSRCVSCGECVAHCPVNALVPKKANSASREVRTVCVYCGVGCGLYLGVRAGQVVGVRGDRENPVNRGALCVKGRFGMDFIHDGARLTKPLIKKDGEFVEASWDEALDLIAQNLAQYRGDQFAAIASAKCTNEENYLLQKLARAVMGSNHVDHCARL